MILFNSLSAVTSDQAGSADPEDKLQLSSDETAYTYTSLIITCAMEGRQISCEDTLRHALCCSVHAVCRCTVYAAVATGGERGAPSNDAAV